MQRTILIRRITLVVLCVAPIAAHAEEGIQLKTQRSLITLPAARNDPSTVFMEADRLEGHSEKETTAEGNVRVRRLGQSFSADWVRYDSAGGELDAKGHVRLEQGGDVIEGDRLRFNLGTERGFMDKPAFKLTPVPRDYVAPGGGSLPTQPGTVPATAAAPVPLQGRGNAERLLFQGPGLYKVEQASYTTCG